MSKIMKAKGKKFDLENEPLRSYNLKSLSVGDKILLKKKLLRELTLIRCLSEKIGVVPREERFCKKPSNNNCSIMQKNIPASRKKKSSEIDKNLKNADAILKVTHSDVSVAKLKGSSCLKKISKDLKTSNTVQRNSKNSIGPQKKGRCSNRNVLTDVVDAHKKNPQTGPQLKSSCNAGAKGCVDPHCKFEQMPSLKSIPAAKLNCRFTEKKLTPKVQQQNINEKGRALRMPQDKAKLAEEHKKGKSGIEAEVQAAESTMQKAKMQRTLKIKEQREASRLVFEKMEATVEFDDFNQAVKELKGLGCQSMPFYVLRQLGLFLKDDDFDDHIIAQITDPANDDLEEGEIRS